MTLGDERFRKGNEEGVLRRSTVPMSQEYQAPCHDDYRMIQPNLEEAVIEELLDRCRNACLIKSVCLMWARSQPQPVGFIVAGGERWRSWTNCAICGRRCRGEPLCREHRDLEPPSDGPISGSAHLS